jgi:hypothetical protein
MTAKKKAPTPKKSHFQKAADHLTTKDPERFFFDLGVLHGCGLEFLDETDRITAGGTAKQLVVSEVTDLGDILQFIHNTIASLDPCSPPTHLGGNGKDFEELLMEEARRLENLGTLTMGRYGTQVSMVDNEWKPVPSYPDFEGVRKNGRQFVIEAKVCTQPSFRVRNDNLKFKQVRHMITRSQFSVSCYIVVHFNARLGATFYDPPFTVALPVNTERDGGWPVWEEYARCKDKKQEFPAISREEALAMGTPVKWHIPARSKKLRPDLLSIVHSH